MPALAASKGLWVGISTGYRKLGLLYQKWRDHFGHDGDDVLVVQGASSAFNPSLDPNMIARASASDPEAAESEWGGGFRTDISAFLDDATIEAAVNYGRPIELPPQPHIFYKAFVDASGGRHDHYTLAVGHKEGERIVIDVCRGVAPPFDPHEATEQYANLAKEYRCLSVVGDNFAQEWVAGAWSRCGVRYVRSELPRSQIYLECLPLFARGLVALPDHKRLSARAPPARATHPPQRPRHRRPRQERLRRLQQRRLRRVARLEHPSQLSRRAHPRVSPTKWETPTARPPVRRAIGLIATRVCRAHLCAQRWTMLAEVTPMNLADANRILRLSDSQLAIVRQAAVPLSPSARDRYLKAVAAELAEAERVDDATVKAMVETRPCAR